MQYASFWRRFGAYILDIIIVLPLYAFTIWGASLSRLFYLYYLLPGLLFSVWYHVYLVARYGGTPGKLLMKIRIAKPDGTAAGPKEAWLRFSVVFILTTLLNIGMLSALFQMTDQEYFALGFLQRYGVMVANAPWWYKSVNVLLQVWAWSEFISMLTNKKRRAVHDFMAGTIVVRR